MGVRDYFCCYHTTYPLEWNSTLRHSWLLCRHKLSADDFFFPFHWVAMGDCQAAAMTVSPLPRHLSSLYIIFSMSLSLRFPFSPALPCQEHKYDLHSQSSPQFFPLPWDLTVMAAVAGQNRYVSALGTDLRKEFCHMVLGYSFDKRGHFSCKPQMPA